jgi:hypothetical protein
VLAKSSFGLTLLTLALLPATRSARNRLRVESLEALSVEMREVAAARDDLREDLGMGFPLDRPLRVHLLTRGRAEVDAEASRAAAACLK